MTEIAYKVAVAKLGIVLCASCCLAACTRSDTVSPQATSELLIEYSNYPGAAPFVRVDVDGRISRFDSSNVRHQHPGQSFMTPALTIHAAGPARVHVAIVAAGNDTLGQQQVEVPLPLDWIYTLLIQPGGRRPTAHFCIMGPPTGAPLRRPGASVATDTLWLQWFGKRRNWDC